ncbi:MAG TPA: ATP synthase F1 subunit gamma [Thermoanaerobaculaceae bacterium]|nr:ATP synthase F1 subunit gamma [Thermoanaerobaculaceae bacterium]HPS77003.1 ATP synthase F1 subunit gamma [Thermoanaerobaculaceae bacterium]
MATKADLRRRIRSVRSTQQITKAMKMVAAAKLRRAQQRIIDARPYASALHSLLESLMARAAHFRHPLLETRPERRVTLVAVTGDKGLCGAFNSNVLRETYLQLRSGRWEEVELLVVGRRGPEFFRHRGITPSAVHPEMMRAVTVEAAYALARTLADRFASGDTDAVYFVYNQFRSVITQHVELERWLPVETASLAEGVADSGCLMEPTAASLLHQLLPRHLQFGLLRILLDSAAAEHAARMTAMDAASKNAAEMIEGLTLTYNRVRQATITRELIEIVSGAQALAER